MLKLVARGQSNHAIAQALFVSENTVCTHLRKILGKLGARSITAECSIGFPRHRETSRLPGGGEELRSHGAQLLGRDPKRAKQLAHRARLGRAARQQVDAQRGNRFAGRMADRNRQAADGGIEFAVDPAIFVLADLSDTQ